MNRRRWYWTLALVTGVTFVAVTVALTAIEFFTGRGAFLLTLGGVTLALIGGVGAGKGASDERRSDGPTDGDSASLEFGLVLGVGVSLLIVLAGLVLTVA